MQVFVQTHGADEVVVTYAVCSPCPFRAVPLTLGGKASTTHSRQQTASERALTLCRPHAARNLERRSLRRSSDSRLARRPLRKPHRRPRCDDSHRRYDICHAGRNKHRRCCCVLHCVWRCERSLGCVTSCPARPCWAFTLLRLEEVNTDTPCMQSPSWRRLSSRSPTACGNLGAFRFSTNSCSGVLISPSAHCSTRGGLGMLFVSFSALIGTPIAGAILRATPSSDGKPSNYTGVCAFGGCSVLLGTACLTVARQLQVRRKGTWRV